MARIDIHLCPFGVLEIRVSCCRTKRGKVRTEEWCESERDENEGQNCNDKGRGHAAAVIVVVVRHGGGNEGRGAESKRVCSCVAAISVYVSSIRLNEVSTHETDVPRERIFERPGGRYRRIKFTKNTRAAFSLFQH